MQHALARPDSQFLCCTCVYFLCDILWPEVQPHSGDSHVHTTGPHSACALAQAHPTMVHLRLVHLHWIAVKSNILLEIELIVDSNTY